MNLARGAAPAPAHPTSPQRRAGIHATRRRVRLILSLIGGVVVIVAALSAYALVSARHELQAGLVELHAAEKELSVEQAQRAPLAVLSTAQARVERAHADFHDAATKLAPLAPVLRHLAWVPSLGGKLSAAPDAASTSDAATAGVLQLLDGVQPIAVQYVDAPASRRPRLAALVEHMAARRSYFDRACTLFREALSTRRQIPSTSDSTLRSALQTFDRQLPRLDTTCKSLQLLPGLLGVPQQRTYLVAYQDKLELRATGGFIGSLAVLRVKQGHIHQKFSGADFLEDNQVLGAHESLAFGTPEPMRLYNQEAYWFFRDSNWSPDFPTTAKVESLIFHKDTSRTVDGVIDMTIDGAADLLRATGPLFIPEYNRWVTAANVANLANYYTHVSEAIFASQGGYRYFGPKTGGNFDTRRKQFIGIVAHHAFQAITHPTIGTLLRLGSSLADAFARKDILMYVPDQKTEALIRSVGASGAINPTRSDYLYVVDTNIGYTKNNNFIHLTTTYNVHIRPDRWLDARLTIHLHNNPAPSWYKSLGWWGPGGGSLGGWDDYATFLRVFVPAGAQLIDQNGWTQPWLPGPAYGKTMFCGYLIVRRGQSGTVHLHYVIPPNVLSWSGGKRYRLVVQHQPGTLPDRFSLSVSGTGMPRHTATVLHPQTDWRTTFPIPARQLHPIPLPAQPSTTVEWDHWIEPHAFLGPPS